MNNHESRARRSKTDSLLGDEVEIIMGQSPPGYTVSTEGGDSPFERAYRIRNFSPDPGAIHYRAEETGSNWRSIVLRTWFDHRSNELGRPRVCHR